jgi:hypothetical protein
MTMETSTSWSNVLISSAPFILLIVFWFAFLKKGVFSKQRAYMDKNVQLFERQVAVLERIANAMEERNKRS